jgi:hypothetical protein
MVYTAEGLKEFLTTPLPVFNGYTADLMLIGEYNYQTTVTLASGDSDRPCHFH